MAHQLMIVLNLGGTAAFEVARRVRECGVYCEVLPHTITREELVAKQPRGVVLTGGYEDVAQERVKKVPWLSECGLPVLEVGRGTSLSVEALSGGVGKNCLNVFLRTSCDCIGDWSLSIFLEETIEALRERIGSGRVLLGLSGGVDSSVTAALLSRAVGKQLVCIFIDNGFMRKDEGDEIEAAFQGWDMTFLRINAETKFLFKLLGQTEPQRKRQIISDEQLHLFGQISEKMGGVQLLARGTTYTDLLTGHLVPTLSPLTEPGEGPQMLEPIHCLFKEEVRALALELGLPEYLAWRQPFPGAGLSVRCVGCITKERLEIVRQADAIFREELANRGMDRQLSQAFAIVTEVKTSGIRGDRRTNEYTVALRAVTGEDLENAEWAELPSDLLRAVSRRITTEVKGVNRVVYDITSTPPATVEWE